MGVRNRVIDFQQLAVVLSVKQHIDSGLLDTAFSLIRAKKAVPFHLAEPCQLVVVAVPNMLIIENPFFDLTQCAHQKATGTTADIPAEEGGQIFFIFPGAPALLLILVTSASPQFGIGDVVENHMAHALNHL